MTTLAPSASPNAAEVDRIAHLALIDAGGTNLADLTHQPQTIGGGPRCSVRLDATGLRPLHCVITPSEEGPVVRRWAAETHLNGLDFTEAALTAGDLLRIGSIDLRVVAMPSETVDEEAEEPLPNEEALLEESAADEVSFVDLTDSDTTPFEPISVAPVPADESDSEENAEPECFAEDAEKPAATSPVADFDPAIPSRLLRPWAPSEPIAEVAIDVPPEPATELRSTTADDPFAAWSGFEDTTEPAFEPVLQQPAFVEETPVVADSEIDASDDPWLVATRAPAKTNDAIPAFDPAAAAAFSVEVDNELTPATDDATVLRLGARAAANRARAGRLVALIRAERQQTAELAGAVSDLASQLEQALAASDEASAELARMANEHAAAEHDHAALREVLAEATGRAARLEAQVTELDNQVSQLEASLAALSAAPAAQEPVSDYLPEPVAPALGAAEADWSASAWREEAEAVQVFADEVIDDTIEPNSDQPHGEESSETDVWREFSAEQPAPEADEPLWGIERLVAATGEEAATDSPWAGFVTERRGEEPAPETQALWNDEPAPTAAIVEPLDKEIEADEPVAMVVEYEEASAEELAADEPANDVPAYDEVAGEDTLSSKLGSSLWGATEQADEDDSVAPPKPEPPVSFIERFAYLVPEEDEPVHRPVPVASVPTAPASDDDESIDDYMRKLMQRVRGSSTHEQSAQLMPMPTKKPVAVVPDTVEEDRDEPVNSLSTEAAEPKPELLRDISELRRGPAPEVKTDMGALRQLANQSARHAIDVAASRQSREKATMRLAVSVISVAVGALASIVADNPLDLQFIGGFTSVVVGGWFFVRTVKQCQVRTLDEQIALAAKQAG